jgi:hypothetical protein
VLIEDNTIYLIQNNEREVIDDIDDICMLPKHILDELKNNPNVKYTEDTDGSVYVSITERKQIPIKANTGATEDYLDTLAEAEKVKKVDEDDYM